LVTRKEITFSGLFKAQSASFQKNARAAKKLGTKNIHSLRVDIKHLRALLRLAELFGHSESFQENILKQLKPVFKSAGNIRTTSVSLQLVQNYNGLAPYTKRLKKLQKEGGKTLKEALKKFNLKLFTENCSALTKKLNGFSRETIITKSLEYVDYNRKKIKAAYKATISDDDLHEIRKELKIIKTTFQILYKLTQQKLFKKHIKSLTLLEETIGGWHDKAVLHQDLIVFNKTFSAGPRLIAFTNDLKTENKLLKKKVLGLLTNYFK
jgi:CHAD domain-containing protein